uniref:Putative secreted protein n=1 Tax=Anopheles darlingi TaxID=43151 RepID=A0A2M4D2H3_ANODA
MTNAAFTAFLSCEPCFSTSCTSASIVPVALSPRSSPSRTRSREDTLPSSAGASPQYDNPTVTAFSLDPLSAPQLAAGLLRMVA